MLVLWHPEFTKTNEMTDGAPRLLCVAPHLVEAMWPHVVKLIETALIASESDLTPQHVKAKIDAGKALLWIIWDDAPHMVWSDSRGARGRSDTGELLAAGTTELVTLENGRKLCVIGTCAGRDMKSWKHFLADIERWAAQEGCEAVRFYGRPGWARTFKDQGYVQPWIVVEKRI
jgi:hypothetical protein